MFQTRNYVGLKNLRLKYQRPTPTDFKDIRIKKFKFETKYQFHLNTRC